MRVRARGTDCRRIGCLDSGRAHPEWGSRRIPCALWDSWKGPRTQFPATPNNQMSSLGTWCGEARGAHRSLAVLHIASQFMAESGAAFSVHLWIFLGEKAYPLAWAQATGTIVGADASAPLYGEVNHSRPGKTSPWKN
jgi:hypothetical protein